MTDTPHDPINHPSHYTTHPSGIECIQITEHMNFNLGNTVKYLWRAGLKDQNPTLQDLKKAAWYLAREIQRREREHASTSSARDHDDTLEYNGCRVCGDTFKSKSIYTFGMCDLCARRA